MFPDPRTPLADPGLTRPNWLDDRPRDPTKLWLDKNENTDPALGDIVAGLARELPPDAMRSYPELGNLYRSLAAHLGCEPSQLILAAGSEGAIRSTFDAFVGPGDTVVHTAPTFAMYPVYSSIYGARQVTVAYRPTDNGPELDTEELLATIRAEKPKLLCLPNPDSPTGTIRTPEVMRRIVETAVEAGSVALIDEAYFPFYEETVLPWVDEFPNLIVTRTFDKAWGLAGFRIGCAVANSRMIGYLNKVRSGYEIPAIAVSMLERMLDFVPEVKRSAERLEAGKAGFQSAMAEMGFRTFPSYGSFAHVAFGEQAETIHRALSDIVLYRRDFSDPCLRGFSRFSTTTPELFAPVIACIEQVRNLKIA